MLNLISYSLKNTHKCVYYEDKSSKKKCIWSTYEIENM